MSSEQGIHNIILENRKKILLTGVKDVLHFGDDVINAVTNLGEVTIRGTELKMNNFNADKGDLSAEGNIVAIVYTASREKEGFLSKIFR